MQPKYRSIMQSYILSSHARTWDGLSSWMQERIIVELLNDPETEPDDMYALGKFIPALLFRHYTDRISAAQFIELFMSEAKFFYRKYLDRIFDGVMQELLDNGYVPKTPDPDAIDFTKGFS